MADGCTTIGVNVINLLVYITVMESVYSAVRNDCLYKAGFYNRGGKFLQRGTE
jgi:hypothetical protein